MKKNINYLPPEVNSFLLAERGRVCNASSSVSVNMEDMEEENYEWSI